MSKFQIYVFCMTVNFLLGTLSPCTFCTRRLSIEKPIPDISFCFFVYFYCQCFRRRIQKKTHLHGKSPGAQQDSNRNVQAQPLRERRHVRAPKIHTNALL